MALLLLLGFQTLDEKVQELTRNSLNFENLTHLFGTYSKTTPLTVAFLNSSILDAALF